MSAPSLALGTLLLQNETICKMALEVKLRTFPPVGGAAKHGAQFELFVDACRSAAEAIEPSAGTLVNFKDETIVYMHLYLYIYAMF
jgi:hypothetical protein